MTPVPKKPEICVAVSRPLSLMASAVSSTVRKSDSSAPSIVSVALMPLVPRTTILSSPVPPSSIVAPEMATKATSSPPLPLSIVVSPACVLLTVILSLPPSA